MSKMPFVEKYKPERFADLVLDKEIVDLVRSYVDKKNMCNLLLVGHAGLGKSSLARVIVNELDATHLYINASVDNNVDTMRFKVREFCCTMAINQESPKIVILDEANSLSSNSGTGSSAQSALKNIIEENLNDTRFILTANIVGQIDPAIQSRCTPLQLKASPKSILQRCIDIMKAEGVRFGKESATAFYEQVVKKLYPDIRLTVNNLEHWCATGELKPSLVVSDTELSTFAATLVGMVSKRGTRPYDVRKFVIEGEQSFGGDFNGLARVVFDLHDGQPAKQVRIAEYMYRMSQVVDTEVQLAAMLYELMEMESEPKK